ncbi:McrC family protein [Aurantimonas sp. MSK8Z-1]|uniref:McrC family protein n=1 Tax=Mangrovibrevibacter kandeliae TaxID=2968473 RepID=UPI002117C466|nr:McrC family protein [Aurantimonas sp. MSK8Z-1]MCW4116379.1 McrC family protein [Aurantimonas sp. MSK8Z-1]
MIVRTILEWGSIAYGDGDAELPDQAADRIAAVAAASPLAGRGEGGVLEHGRKALRARGVVGLIAADGVVLEILPKIDVPGDSEAQQRGNTRKQLVHMLAEALDMKIDTGAFADHDWQRNTLLEILIRTFSSGLVDAVRQGMPRRYVLEESDLPALRGRLNVQRQFTALVASPQRLACRYDALSPEIALNRIMKAAVTRLLGITRALDNRRRLQELALTYAEIAAFPVAALPWNDVVLDRTNLRWRSLLKLAKLLLGERFQTTSSGGVAGVTLLFEMNTLFEEYVARMLAHAVAKDGLKVVAQGGRVYCLEVNGNQGLFQTRPDILIKRGDQVVQVIDTKWKRIAKRVDDPKQGVSQSDIYQMMAYGRLYGCRRLTLLYPHHSGIGKEEAGRLTSHEVFRSGGDWLETATIDITSSRPALLAGLRDLCSFQERQDEATASSTV